MKRKAKAVTTKDGYTVKKHSLTFMKDRFYSIEKDGVSKGWYRYEELCNALKVCRLMEDKNIFFGVHNNRELILLQAILSDCKLVKDSTDEYIIHKINGMINACFMLDMLLEPLIIITLDDVIELRMILNFYLNLLHQNKFLDKLYRS